MLNKRNNGLVIDGTNKLPLELSYKHLALIAPTGAGKTTSYIIPNLLNLQNSAVITDPSGEIFNKTAGYLKSQGFKIKVINATNLNNSLKYNPLHRAKTHTEIECVSEVLINSAYPNATGEQSFWNDGASTIINILIRCLKKEPLQYQNPHNLRYLLNSFGSNGKILNDFIIKNTEADPQTFNEWKGFINNDEKVTQGMLASAKTALKKFSNIDLCQLTKKETLHFETLRTEKTVLYIIVPEHKHKHYSFFLSLLYTQIFDYCMRTEEQGKPYQPIFFLLDEFGNMKIPHFSNLITTLRKRKCSCSLVLQNTEQLNNVYGISEASTIISNCSSQIYFSGLGLKTCEELERLLGKTTIMHTEQGQRKIGNEADSVIDRETSRSLLTADEIRTMKDDEAIFIHGNKRPIMLSMKPYFENRGLLQKTKIKPVKLNREANNSPLEYIQL